MDTKRLTYTVDEASKMLRLSLNSAYEGVVRGDIPSIRVGRRLLIPKAVLDRLLETAIAMAVSSEEK